MAIPASASSSAGIITQLENWYRTAAAFAVANVLTGPHTGDFFYVFPFLDAVVLALLGPGAYSLDARLFGRSVTVMPPRRNQAR